MLDAWGDVWEFRGSLWFVSLSINHTLISFVVCELNALQQPVAMFPLFITVWELCCAGGSPCSAPGRSRGHQLVHHGLHWGTDTGRRVGMWIIVWVNICSAGGLFKKQQWYRIQNNIDPSVYSYWILIVAKPFSSLHLATWGVVLLTFQFRLMLGFVTKTYLFWNICVSVYRRLHPWFKMP